MASEIGSYHLDVNIDSLVTALTGLFVTITGELHKVMSAFRGRCEEVAL